MKLKNGQLFWGFFFFTIGILFLFEKKDYFIIDFETIISYWPILLIIAGLTIMLKGTFLKPVLSVASGVMLGFFVFSPFALVYHGIEFSDFDFDFDDKEYKHITFTESLIDSGKDATLKIETGMGKVSIEGTTNKLYDAYASGYYNTYDVKTNHRYDRTIVKFDHEPNKFRFNGIEKKNHLKISLSELPVWDMKLEFGAAKANIDLSEYKIGKLSMHTGASSTKLRFGERSERIDAKIEMGAAALRIYIPHNSGCELESKMFFVSRDFDGFEKLGDGRYVSENFSESDNKIYIELDGGISSLKILRY